MEDVVQPELKDIIEMIQRYVNVNKRNVCFVGRFVAFDEEKVKRGEGFFKPGANRLFAYGYKDTLNNMLDELRDMIEDEADKEGFVNL